MFSLPITGVIQPSNPNISGNEVPLSANWILLIVALVILAWIIIKRIINKQKNKLKRNKKSLHF
jgi:flagellar biosynthesis/type III secretory pathway M-ring protein FliF/YscJ